MKPPSINNPGQHLKTLGAINKLAQPNIGLGRGFGKMPNFSQSPTISPEAIESLFRDQGQPMRMYKPLPCPNVKTLGSETHPPNCDKCENGFRYFGMQEFIGAFNGQQNQRQFLAQGSEDRDICMMTLPTHDKDGQPLRPGFFCKIEVKAPISFYQHVQASQSGIDRLLFQALEIEHIIDSTERVFRNGVDYKVSPHGAVEWLTNNRPGYNAQLGMGNIYSCYYIANAVYIVDNIPEQVQTIQVQGPGGPGTPNVIQRVPSVVTVRRKFVPQKPLSAQNGSV